MNASASPWPEGLLTPLLTPLKSDELDRNALARLLEQQVQAGVGAVVVGGGTGEYGTLSIDERRRLASDVAGLLDGRLPFLVQTGTLATRDALALSRHAEEVGATGLLVASPFGEPISWRERRRFYEDVNDATSLPIMVYNTPPAGILSLPEIEELAGLARVSAIKDSSADITLLGDLLAWAAGRDFAAYVGVDSLVPFGAANGAHGVLVGTGNVVPEELITTFRLARDGDASGRLESTWPVLRAFLRFMEDSSNYVALCKVALEFDGLDVGGVRRPYLMPDDEERDALAAHLEAVKRAFTTASQDETVTK